MQTRHLERDRVSHLTELDFSFFVIAKENHEGERYL